MSLVAMVVRRRSVYLPSLAVVAVVLVALAAATACFRHFRAEVLSEAAGDQPFHTAAVRVQGAAGGLPPLLTLDAGALGSGAIVRRRLEAIRFQAEVPAFGSVVDPVDLAQVQASLAAAQGAAAQADARLQSAQAEREPQPTPSGNARALSPEALLAALDTERLDKADVHATTDTLRLRRAVALALYGPALTGLMVASPAELDPFVQQRASLLLLTPLPGHAATSLPAEATVTDHHGRHVPAFLVSVAFRTDPRLQNIAGLYRAADDAADPHFFPGMVLSARLPVGTLLTGVLAPREAVLQYRGRPWVYVEEAPGQFRRHEVSIAQALPDGSGWFQDRALQSGQAVVTAGAELLLGEER